MGHCAHHKHVQLTRTHSTTSSLVTIPETFCHDDKCLGKGSSYFAVDGNLPSETILP